MELQASFEEIIKNLKVDLEKDNEELRKEIAEVGKQWETKMHTDVKLSTDNKVYQASVAIKEAKRQYAEIEESLREIDKSSTIYTILNDKLNYLKEVIKTYQESFDEMEMTKNAIKLKNDNKKVIISNSISKMVNVLEEKETQISEEISKLKENILTCSNADFDKLSSEVKANINALNEINKLKNILSDLNSKDIKSFDENRLNELSAEYKEIAEIYSMLISKYNIKMDNKISKPVEKNYDLEEVLYYLDVAANSNLDKEKKNQALDIALDITNKMEDSELKDDLYADIANAYVAINNDDTIVDPDYELAKSLVEKAEKTEKSKDFFAACDALERVEESKRSELGERLAALRAKAEERFIELLEEMKVEITEDNNLDSEKFLELEDRYKYISTEIAKKYEDDFSNIIIINNNLKQEKVKENYEKKKDGFFTKIGKIVTFVKGSKIASKFNVKKLLKLKASAQDVEDDEELELIEEKANKVSEKLAAGSVVGGLRLFVAQKSLENMKPKLYNGEGLSNRKIKIYNKAVQIIDKQMNKGLEAKSNLTLEAQDKKYVTSVVDQYLYLIATGNDYDSSIEKLEDYLVKISKQLTESESNAIREQMYIIKDYRDATDGDIYEISSTVEEDEVTTELDDIVKYYDSEEYNKSFRNTPIYIKR